MKKTLNILLISGALLMLGYYIGRVQSTKSVKNKPTVISKKENSTKKVSHQLAEDSVNKIVTFNIKIIGASMDKNQIDPELANIKKMFDSVTEFSEFKLIKNEKFSVAIGQKHKILLPNNEFVYFMPKDIIGDRLKLTVRIPWILNVNLHTKNKEGFFQGGLKDGDQFIILYIESEFE